MVPPKSKYHHRFQMYLGHFELFLLGIFRDQTGALWVDSLRDGLPAQARVRLDVDWEKHAKSYRREIDDEDLLHIFDERVREFVAEGQGKAKAKPAGRRSKSASRTALKVDSAVDFEQDF